MFHSSRDHSKMPPERRLTLSVVKVSNWKQASWAVNNKSQHIFRTTKSNFLLKSQRLCLKMIILLQNVD